MRYNEYAGDHIAGWFHLYRRTTSPNPNRVFQTHPWDETLLLLLHADEEPSAITAGLETLLSVTKTIMGTFLGIRIFANLTQKPEPRV